jgi:UDP-glucose 4-epimerase
VVITQHTSHRLPDLLKDEIGARVFIRIYNIGSGRAISHREIFAAVRKAVPDAKCSALRPGQTPNAPANPAEDLSRIKADVGYEPEYTIETGVAAYIEWLCSNPH